MRRARWLALWVPALALGAPIEGHRCLSTSDLACAELSLQDALRDDPSAPATLALQARTLFYQGEYAAAAAALDRLEAAGGQAPQDTPLRETLEATRGFLEVKGDGVRVRYAPGVDAVLAEEAVASLSRARLSVDPLLGGGPDHDIVLDIFPDGRRFIAASGLPPEAVRTTGVVALSKWTRLLLTSPRALARGYAWKDTVAHEYIHLVVSWRTGDRTPVWLQEGLAKHLEGYWRGEKTGHLSAWQQSLLAGAIRSGDFVPFEKFRHSMAYLDSGEEAALAFAQVATMVAYLIELKGEAALPAVLDAIRDGEDAQQAFAGVAGFSDFDRFREGWLGYIRGLPLVEEQLAALPVVLDGEGGDFADDPLLAARQDLARYARVGDLLRESGRPAAALVEYKKAADPKGPPSPLLLAREATCHAALNQLDEALAITARGVHLYPEFGLLQTTRGALLEAAGQPVPALQAWLLAHDLNPFDPSVQAAIVRLAEAGGDKVLAERHRRYASLLATGGVAAK